MNDIEMVEILAMAGGWDRTSFGSDGSRVDFSRGDQTVVIRFWQGRLGNIVGSFGGYQPGDEQDGDIKALGLVTRWFRSPQ